MVLYSEYTDLLWRYIWSADNPVEVLNEHLLRLVGRVSLRPPACAARISIGLMTNAIMLLASSSRLVFGGPVIALRLTGKI